MILQRTLKQAVSAIGVGLHSGERVRLSMLPAPVDHGIVFCRTDLPEKTKISVHPDLVNDTRLSSTLVNEAGVRVSTIEHLMSAFAGLGIDNLLVEVTASEIPIMDGSAAPFIYLLQSAGVEEQESPKKFIRVLREIEVISADKWVRLTPHDGFKLSLSIAFDHPIFALSPQSTEIDFANSSYIEQISRARTFGFMQEVEYMRSNGLGLGGSLDNAIVIDDVSVVNPEGLRFNDEFVRHKILDAIGDLYIIGHPMIAAFSGHKSGHALNNAILRKLLATPDAWEMLSFTKSEDVPSSFHRLPS